MVNGTFLRIALPTPMRRLFDYAHPQHIDLKEFIKGVRVLVPFQSRTLVGILIEVSHTSIVPPNKLKSAIAILDETNLLSDDIFALCEWAANYYHAPLGEVLSCAFPTALRKGQPLLNTQMKIEDPHRVTEIPPTLNEAQQKAISAIAACQKFQSFLLDGVTGSGKTEVYLRAIQEKLDNNKQVLVLVPEISLTPQTIKRFHARFTVPIVTLHSGLSEKKRLTHWEAARSGEARIIIGTRSAIFTPISHLGLIIVDEEHDNSFKQQDRFRYHARDLAVMRAQFNDIPIVLGSATPSLESVLNVKKNRYCLLSLPERAGDAIPPAFSVIDLKQSPAEAGLSVTLMKAMREHLAAGHQTLLYLNRRGFAPVLYCATCTWIAGCDRCDAKMVYHHKPPRLHCHQCDARHAIPKQCQHCSATDLQMVGIGTQRLEENLAQHFPDVPIIRIDRDSTRKKGKMDDLLKQIHEHPAAILIGTQMLAKGHHFPRVTLVGIIEADGGLFSSDFRATEQMGQLLLQVAGRAGRADKPGTVMIQTRHPEHALLQSLITTGYAPFSECLLSEREGAALPPYHHVALFKAEAFSEENARLFLTMVKKLLKDKGALTLLGPVPALLAKRKGLHCQHLLVKAEKRSELQAFLKAIIPQLDVLRVAKSVKWVLDVDPYESV
ncbi:MAG TPA: primosomal protein N' [Gammaproteobacteria bacterium]|jgi:primosomal protein N' (replication factor Y)|nr:primosomal protein N' [Gammaproteobacteria bacterium]